MCRYIYTYIPHLASLMTLLLKQFPFLPISLIGARTLFLHSSYMIGWELLLKQYAFIGSGLLAGLITLLRWNYLIKTSHLSRICWFLNFMLAVKSFFVTYMVVEMYLAFLSCVKSDKCVPCLIITLSILEYCRFKCCHNLFLLKHC